MRSSPAFFTFSMEAPFSVAGIDGISVGSQSVTGMAGKFNSIEKCSPALLFEGLVVSNCLSPSTFSALRSPDFVMNSTLLVLTKPEVKRKCAEAMVACPQSLTCDKIMLESSAPMNLENWNNIHEPFQNQIPTMLQFPPTNDPVGHPHSRNKCYIS